MKNVYLLGAGFSRAAGLPLMNDFYLTSKDIYPQIDEKSKKIFDKIYAFWDEYSKAKHYINVDFFNIEELLSIIEMNRYIFGRRNNFTNDLIHFIKKVIELRTPDLKRNTDCYNVYFKFINYVFKISKNNGRYARNIEDSDSGLISLNYDLIIENVIKNYNEINKKDRPFRDEFEMFDVHYGDGIKKLNNYSNSKKIFDIQFAKLHGSLNFENDLIIPPTWNKTNHKKIQGAWKLAFELLAKTNYLTIIGYSLPQTDSYIKYLLINAIKQNDNLKKISIINPDDKSNTIQNRYSNFFDKTLIEKGMIEFIPLKFEEWVDIYLKDSPKSISLPENIIL